MSVLTERYAEAVGYAATAHDGHTRKSSPDSGDIDTPYVSHLLAVSGLVLEDGGDEDEAIAGLLHDVIEDRDVPPGTRAPEIEARFGAHVLELVIACSGPKKEDSGMAEFRIRKQVYLDHLRNEQRSGAIRVSLADKVHNARSTVNNLEDIGTKTWDRFNSGAVDQLWWYSNLTIIYEAKAAAGLASPTRAAELRRLVEVMGRFAPA
jgi:(p)ppGpp synthase/HD superfamily hydrolase